MFKDLPINLTPWAFEKLKEKLPEKVEQAELLLPGFSCNLVRFNGSITTLKIFIDYYLLCDIHHSFLHLLKELEGKGHSGNSAMLSP